MGVSYAPFTNTIGHVLDSQTLDSQQTTVNPGFPWANTGRWWHAHLCIPSWHPAGRSTRWRYRPERACSLRSYSVCQRECSGSKWSCPPPCHVPHCLPVNTHMHSDPQDQLIGWLMPGIILHSLAPPPPPPRPSNTFQCLVFPVWLVWSWAWPQEWEAGGDGQPQTADRTHGDLGESVLDEVEHLSVRLEVTHGERLVGPLLGLALYRLLQAVFFSHRLHLEVKEATHITPSYPSVRVRAQTRLLFIVKQ